jgi:hypothetical protein
MSQPSILKTNNNTSKSPQHLYTSKHFTSLYEKNVSEQHPVKKQNIVKMNLNINIIYKG